MASRLAGMGHGVVVVDQQPSLTEPVCCTGILGRECINSFALGDELVLRWVKSATIYSPSGKTLRVWRPEPQAAIVE